MVSSGLCHFARSLFCQTQAIVHCSKSSLSCYRIIQRQICFLGKHQGIKIFSPLSFRHVKRTRTFKNLQLNAGYYLWEQKLCSLQAGVTSLGGDLQNRHYHQTLSLQEPFGSRGPGGIHPDQHRSTQETISQLNNISVFSAWGLRLAVENGYLSWCRNTYLCTVVAIALMGEGTTILAQHAAEGMYYDDGCLAHSCKCTKDLITYTCPSAFCVDCPLKCNNILESHSAMLIPLHNWMFLLGCEILPILCYFGIAKKSFISVDTIS